MRCVLPVVCSLPIVGCCVMCGCCCWQVACCVLFVVYWLLCVDCLCVFFIACHVISIAASCLLLCGDCGVVIAVCWLLCGVCSLNGVVGVV